MKIQFRDADVLSSRLKHLVADLFRLDLTEPEEIAEHEPLIGGAFGLDSSDVCELVMCIEEEFGVTIEGREQTLSALASIASLTEFIQAKTRSP